MKKHNKLLAMLMALAMVLAYMPAMAFAEGEEPAADDGTPAVEEVVEVEDTAEEAVKPSEESLQLVEEKESIKVDALNDVGEDWYLYNEASTYWNWPGDDYLYGWATLFNEEIELEYQWLKDGSPLTAWTDLTEVDEDGDLYNEICINTSGTYTFSVREKTNPTQTASRTWTVYYYSVVNGIVYGPGENDNTAWAEDLNSSSATGNIVIPPTITLADGKTRTVTEVAVYSPNAASISIPASVTHIWNGVGLRSYDLDDNYNIINPVPIPGFVIYGTNGSYAQVYANKYGIAFSDPVNGTPDGSIAKVKMSKPSTAKKAITVKWKKFTKKQLKKSGAISYEIWVATDPGFTNVVKTATAGKKKASKKIKVPAKGTYYVKVRAIKQVGVFKMAGAWSKAKKVKVKK